MEILLFACALALLVFTSLNFIRTLEIFDKIERIQTLMLLAAANIVLSTYVLSLISLITVAGYLAVQSLLAGLSWLVLQKWGKPGPSIGRLSRTYESGVIDQDPFPKWVLIVFFSVITFTALVNLFLSVYVAPNNWDSMTQHMSRVGYWLQQGSLAHYYSHDLPQNVFPPNAEILILWPVTFLRSDIFANTVQWLAYCGIGFTIFSIAVTLGYGRRTSAFASLIYMSLPMVVLQSSTTQNDLVVTFFTINFFYFLHTGFKYKDKKRLLLSGIAIGLALGTKYTLFFALPALGFTSLVFIKLYKVTLRQYAVWCVFCVIGIFLFGSYNYFLNYRDYGNPISPPRGFKIALGNQNNLEKIAVNAFRYAYDFCDFRGVPEPLQTYLSNGKKSIAKRLLDNPTITKKYTLGPFTFRIFRTYSESSGWFGVLGILLFAPVALWFFLGPLLKRSDWEKWLYVFIPFFFFLFFCYLQLYTSHKGRYFVLPIAFIAPLTVSFTRFKSKRLVIGIAVCVVLFGSVTAINASLANRKKPILAIKKALGHQVTSGKLPVHIFDADVHEKRVGFGYGYQILPFLRFIERAIAPGSRIGHVFRPEDWDYPLFGRDFSRVVIPVKPKELKRGVENVIAKYNLDFLIISISKKLALTASGLILFANSNKRFFNIFSAQNCWSLHTKKGFILKIKNFSRFFNPPSISGFPEVMWAFGESSTILISSVCAGQKKLVLKFFNRWFDNQTLAVYVNGKPQVTPLAIKKQRELQTLELPLRLKPGVNLVLLKYARWKRKGVKRKLPLLYHKIKLKSIEE